MLRYGINLIALLPIWKVANNFSSLFPHTLSSVRFLWANFTRTHQARQQPATKAYKQPNSDMTRALQTFYISVFPRNWLKESFQFSSSFKQVVDLEIFNMFLESLLLVCLLLVVCGLKELWIHVDDHYVSLLRYVYLSRMSFVHRAKHGLDGCMLLNRVPLTWILLPRKAGLRFLHLKPCLNDETTTLCSNQDVFYGPANCRDP